MHFPQTMELNGTLDFQSTNSTVNSTISSTEDGFIPQHILDILKRQYEDYFLLALNIGALMIFILDKCQAQNDRWRVREVFLHICCLNAPLASLSGMLVAWHKVRKITFYFVILIGLFLMYQSYDCISQEDVSWWKVLGFINLGLTFVTLVCRC